MLYPGETLIGDHNFHEYVRPQLVGGQYKGRGQVPRPYDTHPVGCYASGPPLQSVDFPLIPQSEWPARIADKVAQKSQLSDIRMTGNYGQPIPSLDQGQVGYCWAHSSTGAIMILRAVNHLPYVPLSAYAVAATIKQGKDEGGWGAQSLDFIAQKGVPAQSFWPQGDRNYQNYANKPEVWANAALHQMTAGFVDLQAAQYDRKLSFDQEISLLLSDIPVVKDENWWSHSILGLDAVDGTGQFGICRAASGKLATVQEFELMWGMNDPVTAGIGVRILNSWSDSWKNKGMDVLTGSKAVSDGAVAPRVTKGSIL
jgi:hypothetical protein